MQTHLLDRSARILALVTATLAMYPIAAHAQRRTELTGRFSMSGHAQVSEPRGEFGANTGNGFGIGGMALLRLDPAGIANLRADFGFLTYANSTRRVPLPGTGGLVKLDLKTSSNIVSVVGGPQLLGPSGVFMPYASVLGGFSVFWTESSVEGTQNNNTPFATSTNSSDAVAAYGGAAGAYIRVWNGDRPVFLDLGARYLRHDNVKYLTDTRVKEAFEQNRSPVPVRGRADFLTYYLGANVIVF